jgi:hypothetical protein
MYKHSIEIWTGLISLTHTEAIKQKTKSVLHNLVLHAYHPSMHACIHPSIHPSIHI